MAEKWKLFFIEQQYDQVAYYTPESFTEGLSARTFLQDHYPDIQLKKPSDNIPQVISLLLNDGWEPFSVAGDSWPRNLCFRMKVDS